MILLPFFRNLLQGDAPAASRGSRSGPRLAHAAAQQVQGKERPAGFPDRQGGSEAGFPENTVKQKHARDIKNQFPDEGMQ